MKKLDKIINMILILVLAGLYGYIIIFAFSQVGKAVVGYVYGEHLGWDMLTFTVGAIYLGWAIKGFIDGDI